MPLPSPQASIPSSATRRSSQTLLIDADDTLWQNNIYFERAIASFISLLDHAVHSPKEVREHLNRVERATIAERGYGLRSFRQSLITCFEELTGCAAEPACHRAIVSFAQAIADHEVELLDGVADTLAALTTRHRLLLVTKGDNLEQRDKLARTHLGPFFTAVEVLAEKDTPSYTDLIRRHQLRPESTWMIGNSPKSDINPALAAGLHAVFIPHKQTWILEHEAVSEPTRGRELLELPSFSGLLDHF